MNDQPLSPDEINELDRHISNMQKTVFNGVMLGIPSLAKFGEAVSDTVPVMILTNVLATIVAHRISLFPKEDQEQMEKLLMEGAWNDFCNNVKNFRGEYDKLSKESKNETPAG